MKNKIKLTEKHLEKIFEAKQAIENGKKIEESFSISKESILRNVKDEKTKILLENDTARRLIIGTALQILGIEKITVENKDIEYCHYRKEEECIKPSSCKAFGCNKQI